MVVVVGEKRDFGILCVCGSGMWRSGGNGMGATRLEGMGFCRKEGTRRGHFHRFDRYES